MSPSSRSRRRTPYKPPRDLKEVAFAVLTSVVVFLATSALVWFLRPNQDTGVKPLVTVPTPDTSLGGPITGETETTTTSTP